MAVAEQTASEQVSYSPEAKLAGSCLLGSLFVLGSLALIFNILPTAWHQWFGATETTKEFLNPFLSASLLMIVELIAIVLVGFAGYWLDKNYSARGLRAGSFLGALGLFVSVWITFALANILDRTLPISVRGGVAVLLAAGFVFGLSRLYLLPAFRGFLISLEDQGWFYSAAYKPNQGHKVRRATIAGILTIGFCGIYTMIQHSMLGSRFAENTWYWWVPFTTFTDESTGMAFARRLPLIYNTHLVVPLILGVLLLWLAWRITNWPTFADFLIATEAEINKVSWTTRKRLVTDTIVVLVTVFFLTGFLFAVDILWIKFLSNDFIKVLYVDIRSEQAKQQEKTHW